MSHQKRKPLPILHRSRWWWIEAKKSFSSIIHSIILIIIIICANRHVVISTQQPHRPQQQYNFNVPHRLPPSPHGSYHHHHLLHHNSLNPKINFENAYKELISEIRTIFIKQHSNFDSFFRQVLKLSHADFHRMFSDTYGILYDRHSFIFNNMFRNLENYYNDGTIDLSVAMKEFFSLLYKKMFEELNAQYSFDSVYLNCTVEHMEEMMPFGELPQKLILQVKRSFVAIRTFVQALKYGGDILKTVMELPVTSTCENRLRSLSYCHKCDSGTGDQNFIPICQSSCINSLEKCCLLCHNHLNREWNKYLTDMTKLASRLKTSFNIEHIVSPIHIQISDAIMNFQESGRAISQRLFTKCGRPVHKKSTPPTRHLSRKKRHETNEYAGGYLPSRGVVGSPTGPVSNNPLKPKHQTSLSSSSSSLNIDSIIDSMTNDFKSFKNFWSSLPKRLCSHYNTNEKCLLNETFRKTDTEIPNYQDKNNLEIMNQQISTLRLISINLNNAYNGLEVDFENNFETDHAPVDDEIAGSGAESSGDGSGFIEDDEDSIPNINPTYDHNPINNTLQSSNMDIAFNSKTSTTTPNPSTIDDDSSNLKTLVSKTTSGSCSKQYQENSSMFRVWLIILLLFKIFRT